MGRRSLLMSVTLPIRANASSFHRLVSLFTKSMTRHVGFPPCLLGRPGLDTGTLRSNRRVRCLLGVELVENP